MDFEFGIALPGGAELRYRSHTGDMIGRILFWRGAFSYEPETTRPFFSLAKQARTFLDVGANTGLFTLLACAANPECHVYAFEPVLRPYEALVTNVGINRFADRCVIEMCAVRDSVGKVDFHIPSSEFPTSASLDTAGFRGCTGEVTTVQSVTVDSYVPENAPVDLVKMDVEGFEDQVLRGMLQTIERWRPDIIVECLPDGPCREVDRILRGFGYRFYHLRRPGPDPTAAIEPDVGGEFKNYLCAARQPPLAALVRAGYYC